MQSANGTPINPTAPRTGMPSAAMAKAVAMSVRDMINGAEKPTHTASMAEMGAACVASTGSHILKGTAATMTVFPVVPDYEKYPEFGRDIDLTFGEIGLAGHWMKYCCITLSSIRPNCVRAGLCCRIDRLLIYEEQIWAIITNKEP